MLYYSYSFRNGGLQHRLTHINYGLFDKPHENRVVSPFTKANITTTLFFIPHSKSSSFSHCVKQPAHKSLHKHFVSSSRHLRTNKIDCFIPTNKFDYIPSIATLALTNAATKGIVYCIHPQALHVAEKKVKTP